MAATQQTILRALRDGASFSTSHKEGGSVIRFDGRRFVHAEFGDNTSHRDFASDTEFLAFLRQFFEYSCSRHVWPARVPEADAWRLILRRLEPPGGHAAAGGAGSAARLAGTGAGVRLGKRSTVAVVAVLALAAGLAYLKFAAKADALRAGAAQPALQRVQTPPAVPTEKDWQRVQEQNRLAVEAAKAAAQAPSR